MWPTAKDSWMFCADAEQRRLHLVVIRPCALSRVSLFSSSVRGGGAGGAAGGNSGHCWSRMVSMNEAICASVGFILSRKELTFLEGNTAQQEVTYRRGESWKKKNLWRMDPTYFFKMGITGFKMASKMFMRMEFPVMAEHQVNLSHMSHIPHVSCHPDSTCKKKQTRFSSCIAARHSFQQLLWFVRNKVRDG